MMSTITKILILVFFPAISNACLIPDDFYLVRENNQQAVVYYFYISLVIAFLTIVFSYISIKSKVLYFSPILVILLHILWRKWPDYHSSNVVFSDCPSGINVEPSIITVGILSLLLLYSVFRYLNLTLVKKL